MLTTVEVKTGWLSKINWTQVVGLIVSLAVAFGLPLTEEQKVAILAFAGTVVPIITIILKTFFTNTVTPASAKL